ncbi:hypothetical protein RND81_02G045100 [Saponaria officinalis]|uniref:APO domain-containing protein n=1 Tax=Saponaria officinalis TaxID=3572 RepID=A0AAW1MQX4_SAPOF
MCVDELGMNLAKRSYLCQLIYRHHYRVRRHFSGGGSDDEDIKVIPFGEETHDDSYIDLPEPRKGKSVRKPYPTPMKILIQRAKEEKELMKLNPCRILEHPPDNGLLVPELVEVSKQVYWARESLLIGISKLLPFIPVLTCRFCSEVHVGHVGHDIRSCTGPKSGLRSAMHVWRIGRLNDVIDFPRCFHLFDRVKYPRVVHKERFDFPRIPAVLELCIQAGVDLEKYPAKRRTKPVYSIEGRIEDFEPQCNENVDDIENEEHKMTGSEENQIHPSVLLNSEESNNRKELSIGTMTSWFEMISGVRKIMEKYSVWTCGYCPEVQVGPKGHKVRMCKASKHQSRDGMHAWQQATIDDLVGPNYVWHVRDPSGPPLCNNLKRYYGKAPAVVELCVQAGAPVPNQYRSMMRLDVVPPDRDEVDLVA